MPSQHLTQRQLSGGFVQEHDVAGVDTATDTTPSPSVDMRRVSVMGINGHVILRSLAVPATSRVWELEEHVALASGTAHLDQRLVFNGSVLRRESSLEAASVGDGAELTLVVSFTAVEYRVMQGPVFKKLGEEPNGARKTVKSARQVGSKVRTTGKLWTGPAGGSWVQVDSSYEKPGWLLIEGPGFNHIGPLLEKVKDDEEEPVVLRVKSPIDPEQFFHVCVRPSATLVHAKYWIMCQCPGIKRKSLVFVTDDPKNVRLRNFPASWVKKEDTRISDLGLKDGDELLYMYVGDATFDTLQNDG